ncbi:MAG: cytosine permease [bacterium]|nr:cytosine permease [bacterium]
MKENKRNTLISDDVLPVTSRRRALSGLGFANIWIGMAIVISVFSFGASGIEKMGVIGVASATFVANLIIAFIGSLTGDIGVEHGLSFATYLRAPFGTSGVHLPSVARGIIASCWFGINTYIGSTAINYFTMALFGIDNWFLWFVIFAALQVINTMLGIKAIDKFSSFAAPCIILITCWMFYKVNNLAALQNFSILGYHPAQPSASYWFVTMSANMGMWAALAADIPNMTRSLKAPMGEKNWFKRNINNWIPQFATLPIIEAFIAIIGAISFKTTGNWNPVEVIQQQATGVTLVILLVMVILAQWSTNTAANLVPPAMCFTNAGARWKLPYKLAVIIAGLIGCLVQPWNILNQLYTYLGYFGSILSAIAGIMICDYYIIRRRRLNVQDLYKSDGQYRYHGGINLCGMAALIAGTILANIFSDFGYFFGFPAAFIVYFALMKLWYLKKFPQAEVESNYDNEYLGISAGRDWIIPGYEKQAGYDIIPEINVDVSTAEYTGGKEYEERTGNRLIITFGRQYGSRGRELAAILAKKLDIPFYDEDMIKYTSKALNISESKVRNVEEMQRSELLDLLTAGSIYAAKEYDASTSDKMFKIQSKIILQLAKMSPCIIVGRLSNYVLNEAGVNTIDVFVAANYEDRVKNVEKRGNMSRVKAENYINKKEKNREYYFNYFSTYEWGKPEYYDLCVNTSSMGLDELADHIEAYINAQ